MIWYQLMIFMSITASGFFGRRAPLWIAGAWALWTCTHVFMLPLMVLQFMNIGFSLMLGSGIGGMTDLMRRLLSPPKRVDKKIEHYGQVSPKEKAFEKCDWCEVWSRELFVEVNSHSKLCAKCLEMSRGDMPEA